MYKYEQPQDRVADPKYLKQLALEEFYQARQCGRLVAMTGSYANVHLGYKSWQGFIDYYFEKVLSPKNELLDSLSPHKRKLLENIKIEAMGNKASMSAEQSIDLVEYILGLEKLTNPDGYHKLRKSVLKTFDLTPARLDPDAPNISAVLFDDLRVLRAITLNYDLELEWDRFAIPSFSSTKNRKHEWANLNGYKGLTPKIRREGHRLWRDIPGRGKVVSDVLTRENPEVLVEFLLGSSDVDTRILHMHGRKDTPDNMLLSRRDYRDLYWRRGYSKQPFEYARQALFAGNSILFVGLGLSEDDVMRHLEQFMSDNPSRVRAPHFVIWNSNFKNDSFDISFDEEKNGNTTSISGEGETVIKKLSERQVDHIANNLQRLKIYRQYGIHVLFDTEIAELFPISGTEINFGERLENTVKHYLSEIETKSSGLPKNIGALRLSEPLKTLSLYCRERWSRRDWHKIHFWSPQLKYKQEDAGLIELWGVDSGELFTGRLESDVETASGLMQGETKPVLELLTDRLVVISKTPGTGKGTLANDIAKFLHGEDTSRRIVFINGPFISETDSIFAILSGAADSQTAWSLNESRLKSMEDAFDSNFWKKRGQVAHANLTLVFNGLERLIGQDGRPLSIELDTLVRRCVEFMTSQKKKRENVKPGEFFPSFNIIIIGTSRILRYISAITDDFTRIEHAPSKDDSLSATSEKIFRITPYENVSKEIIEEDKKFYHYPHEGMTSYFDWLESGFKDANISLSELRRDSGSRVTRRLFFKQILDKNNLSEYLNFKRSALDKKINVEDVLKLFTVLAFIGQPVCKHTLENIHELKTEEGELSAAELLSILFEKRLVIRLKPFSEKERKQELFRYGLHKSLLAELRVQNGFPHSDSKLASGFNLSLFVARPGDSYSPDINTHNRLDEITDNLISSYAPQGDELVTDSTDLCNLRHRLQKFGHNSYSNEDVENMSKPSTTHGLRAALSMIRSYYSTSTLLKHSFDKVNPQIQFSPLKKHAIRIETLIRVARDVAVVNTPQAYEDFLMAVKLIRTENNSANQKILIEAAQSLSNKVINGSVIDTLIQTENDLEKTRLAESISKINWEKFPEKHIGFGALEGRILSSDDLVWLYNELGVVYLAQGKLYHADRAFKTARDYNKDFVEFGERLHNWRRISLNAVQLMIDRGQVDAALELLRDIETSIDENAPRMGRMPQKTNMGGHIENKVMARRWIVKKYAKTKPGTHLSRIDPHFPEELILSTALCLGYRGVCLVLQGAYEKAEQNYNDALAILNHLDEKRAIAWFKKHLASPLAALGKHEEVNKALQLSLASAGATRQADIDHHARVALAWHSLIPKNTTGENPSLDRIPQLMESLKYAKNNEMRRLQCEVLHLLAMVHMENKDYDSALRHASDAMAVAAKNGHGLRKVGLRTLMAQIFLERGNRSTGLSLLNSALNIATTIGYEKAIEKIESIRVSVAETDEDV